MTQSSQLAHALRTMTGMGDSGRLPDSAPMETPKISVGVCAMERKARAKAVQTILSRMNEGREFEIIVFPESVILNDPVESWPRVACLMSWHSDGFPLAKAQAYARLRHPLLINDVFKQSDLLDRRTVHQKLTESRVPVPRHIVVSRTPAQVAAGADPPGFVETYDYVEMDGVAISKPFVEKPVDAENHNIWIYYPNSSGGGVKMLFRKVGDKSADYQASHPGTVRRGGSFIYEEFLSTGGADVKVYAVGGTYAHAEARKSPVVDGKVQRSPEGKEERYPVLLSPVEKEIARKVSVAFGQRVCGFDLLRCNATGRSYVCDVNGWSMVKSSKKYYDDAADILRATILAQLAPRRLAEYPLLPPSEAFDTAARELQAQVSKRQSTITCLSDLDAEIAHTELVSAQEELRCVLAVIRHGDRTPKQKIKMKVAQRLMLDVFQRFKDEKGKQAKLKSPAQLQLFLDAVKTLLAEDGLKEELRDKLHIVNTVLGHGGSFSGVNRKVQMKPTRADPATGNVLELQLIVKWGGVLTHLGRQQAEDLGFVYRKVMYPSALDDGGLLRLHSTFRHDFKCHSSDEGRVQTTAAAFIKSLLDLEGASLTPILVSLVNPNSVVLDAFGKGASEDIAHSKRCLYQLLTLDPASGVSHCAPAPQVPLPRGETPSPAPRRRLESPGRASSGSDNGEAERAAAPAAPLTVDHLPEQPLALLRELVAALRELVDACRRYRDAGGGEGGRVFYAAMLQDPSEYRQAKGEPYGVEDRVMMHDRWCKLLTTFYSPDVDTFDISKIPDIYDSAKYDCIHNRDLGLDLSKVYPLAKKLADCVIGAEYGVTQDFKVRIATKIASELLGKLMLDFRNVHKESLKSAEADADQATHDAAAAALREEEACEPSMYGTSPKGDAIHRLAPTYLEQNRINSPQRHVRTRMYFTSESHIHALMNILRYTHTHGGESLLSDEGRAKLSETLEYDYLTQIVLRMYERKDVPIGDEERFRIEIMFSPGAVYDPTAPGKTVTQPRAHIHRGNGVSLRALERHLDRYAAHRTPKTDVNEAYVLGP